jgi:hypothetical protein
MNKTHQKENSRKEHDPWAQYSYTYRPKRKKSVLKPLSKILGIGILAGGLYLAAEKGYRLAEEYIDRRAPETAQGIPELQSSSPTRHMDAIMSLDIESLDICRPAKNLGHLIQKKENSYTVVDSINSTNPDHVPFAVAAAVSNWEAGDENHENHLSWFRERPESKFVNYKGAIGKWGITAIALDDYNRRHPHHKIGPETAWKSVPNTTLGLDRLVEDLEYRDGDFFLADLDYVSGRRTTNLLLRKYDTVEDLTAKLWDDDSEPVWNDDWKKRITQPMLDQARYHPNEVAVLTYLVDILMREAGIDPEQDIAERLRPGYRRFVRHGERMYAIAEKEFLERDDGNQLTVENRRLSRYFENRLRDEYLYSPFFAANQDQ